MNASIQNTDIKPNILLIISIQAIVLLLLIKSFALWAIFVTLFIGAFLLYIYPELGFAFAFTNNILLYLFFDYVKVDITAPVIIVYFLIIGGCVVFYLQKQKTPVKIEMNKILAISLLIGVVMMLGFFYSSNKGFGAYKIAFYFIYNIPLLLVGILLKKNLNDIIKLLLFTYIIGVIVSVISFIISADNLYFSFMRFRPTENVSPITLSRTLGTSIICTLFLFVNSKNVLFKSLFLFSIPLLLAPMIWSGTRAPLLGIIGASLLYYFLQPSQTIYRKFVLGTSALSFTLFLLLKSSTQIAARMTTPVAQEASAAFRILAWFTGLKDFASSPLLGKGTGSFILDANWIELKWAHNLIIELAGENGIFGLVLILLFIFYCTSIGLKNITYYSKNKNQTSLQLSICLLALFSFTLWNAMFSGAIFANSIIWFSAGLIIATKPAKLT